MRPSLPGPSVELSYLVRNREHGTVKFIIGHNQYRVDPTCGQQDEWSAFRMVALSLPINLCTDSLFGAVNVEAGPLCLGRDEFGKSGDKAGGILCPGAGSGQSLLPPPV